MPIEDNTYSVPINFVEQYDDGQKKICANQIDENFSDAADAINTILSGDGTISGNNTYSGDNTVTGDNTVSGDVTFTGTVDLTNANVEGADFVPVGTIIWSANATVPAGYLLCNGSAVGRETYPELFAAIGTTFGSGDGSTTFNLPNLIDKFIEGANSAGVVKAAGVPNITGGAGGCFTGGVSGPFAVSSVIGDRDVSLGQSPFGGVDFDASRSSSIYGNSSTVQPPAVTALPCIKAFAAVIGDATVVAGQLVNEIQSKVALDGSNTSSIGSTLSTYMAHAAMPSGQYETLTIPASGNAVTAPADGYIHFQATVSSTSIGYVGLQCNDLCSKVNIPVNSGTSNVYLPVKSGDSCTFVYNNVDSLIAKFVYANGSYSA